MMEAHEAEQTKKVKVCADSAGGGDLGPTPAVGAGLRRVEGDTAQGARGDGVGVVDARSELRLRRDQLADAVVAGRVEADG